MLVLIMVNLKYEIKEEIEVNVFLLNDFNVQTKIVENRDTIVFISYFVFSDCNETDTECHMSSFFDPNMLLSNAILVLVLVCDEWRNRCLRKWQSANISLLYKHFLYENN